jgi:mannosyltransferase OCH1-like enzyme
MDGFDERAARAYHALIPGAAKSDLFRYCVLYDRGGVYLDIKSGAGPLDTLIRSMDEMIVSTWSWRLGFPIMPFYSSVGELQQWWLACSKGHPSMRRVIDAVIENVETRIVHGRFEKQRIGNVFCKKYAFETLTTTGPIAMTNVLLQNMDGVRLVHPDGNHIMIYDVSGKHKGAASYGMPGPFLKTQNI